MSIHCFTWNVNGVNLNKQANKERVQKALRAAFPSVTDGCYVIGLQEVVSPTLVFSHAKMKKAVQKWKEILFDFFRKGASAHYSNTGVCTMVVCINSGFKDLSDTPDRGADEKIVELAGGASILGQEIMTKCSLGIVLETPDKTQIIIITSHLPAYNYEYGLFKNRTDCIHADRNREKAMHQTEEKMLFRNSNGSLMQSLLPDIAPNVIWMGDLNFRQCGQYLGNSDVKIFDKEKDFLSKILLEEPHFQESPISFPPTFKLAVGGTKPDLKLKDWTDRILYRTPPGGKARLVPKPNSYRSFPNFNQNGTIANGVFEDHTPVGIVFDVNCSTCGRVGHMDTN
jgi:hypothetical protein